MMPEIREFQAFLALVKVGSFSAAAQQLGLTQPAVSAQILKLEQLVGFPLFRRGQEGASLTEQGADLVPRVEEIVKEYEGLLHRAAYWKRSRTRRVKILTDGSKLAQEMRMAIHAGGLGTPMEVWEDLIPDGDWLTALKRLEVDVVLAGCFMKSAEVPGIATVPILQERGITLAWNPAYYPFDSASFSLLEAISGMVILPTPSLALGYRDFLSQWCKSIYGVGLNKVIECKSELDALNACKLGMGVMILPGDADRRMKLREERLETQRTFQLILPDAFTFGIRYRSNEQNPYITEIVRSLTSRLAKMIESLAR